VQLGQGADTYQRPQVAASLSRLFLRGELPQTPGHTRHSASVDERPYDEDKA